MTRFRTQEEFARNAFARSARQFRELRRHGLITDDDITEAIDTGRAKSFLDRFDRAKSAALYRRKPGARRGPVTLEEIAAEMWRRT